ncbi:MAG: bifunctional folylpolyglutamate synthase/dihydrofolate synthase [Prevotellaceae bacterium]|jgi:dihydrofolate synthase/folylpolyglutamate synthase|nr:bifunctional folylpolyglutamate synthase/dihydrofolate synthase [Prevotellaceae bacterium]
MTYKETIDYLYSTLPVFHRTGKAAYKANLDNTLALDRLFGSPHRTYRTVHVAGTNGKGSVSHIIASVLQSAGYSTGLYTSPHLFDFRERIRINGAEISEDAVCEFVAASRAAIESLQPSFFEITSAMAFDHFARKQVDVAVIETGLGGRLDSTNIISPELSVITNIGFDHTDILGNTLEKIAGEKAGIIKPGIPAVVGERHPATDPVFLRHAREQHSAIHFAEDHLSPRSAERLPGALKIAFDVRNPDLFGTDRTLTLQIDLEGDYQTKNAATAAVALAVMKTTGFVVSDAARAEGFARAARNTGLRGRWQIVGKNPTVICDTGHNAHGLALAMRQLVAVPCRQLFIVIGVVGDKDLSSIIPLLPTHALYFFTQASAPRSMNVEELASKCAAAGLTGETTPNVPDAVSKALAAASPDDVIFIGGSTFVVADAGTLEMKN